jgi:hypothetical protein
MELTLRFRDELPATGSPADKHKIRRQLHDQLSVYWSQDIRLQEMNNDLKSLQIATRESDRFVVPRPIVGMKNFFWRYPLNGLDFIPLASDTQEIHCYLNMRIYRPSKKGSILFRGGDIDNQLKTFFDALRVPHNTNELPASVPRDPDPNLWPHMFCLLDDDRAITRLSIHSLRLLTPVPSGLSHPDNYVEIDFDVTIMPITPMSGTVDLLFP